MAVRNSKASNFIFNGVDMQQFKFMPMCETAKEAWTILQNQHEGNAVAFFLGKRFSKTKLERKVLRSLPKQFAIKVTTIEKAKDVTTLKLDKLIDSLRTFELNMLDVKQNKVKLNMAFNVQNTIVSDKKLVETMEDIKK
ncbi:hypothetical protein Golax_011692 [Gossypium laxum]|uniref:Gag-pol polyprotein n=1 Tax=Gossypium laxum TaxID=34288 RepID=A0A7J8ZLA7_9ROSI|nr:hypothetical protein [Gossypium laxum]